MVESTEQDNYLKDLKERAKELNCLYVVQESLSDEKDTGEILSEIMKAIPPGWQYPEICEVQIELEEIVMHSEGYYETPWKLTNDINAMHRKIGSISVFYTKEKPIFDEGPFLKEERRLLKTIAELIGAYFEHKQSKRFLDSSLTKKSKAKSEWEVILDMLRKTDPKLLVRISKKMVNYLIWKGYEEAEQLFEYFDSDTSKLPGEFSEKNFPSIGKSNNELLIACDNIFEATRNLLEEEDILNKISDWIKDDQTSFLISILGNSGSSLEQIGSVVERFIYLKNQGVKVSPIRNKFIKLALIRRVLSTQNSFMKVASRFMEVEDFNNIYNRIIYPTASHGLLGGKSSGLLLAKGILNRSVLKNKFTENVKYPETWYISSDCLVYFMKYNNIEYIAEQNFKAISQVRKEYSYVINVFKNSITPPDIKRRLIVMLEEFGEKPLIVRSTSLLEDRQNAIFAGKYKSLFIVNKGTMAERVEELTDAIAEVYASTFGPDPIEYRNERQLLCYNEEMGIMIQEVIGTQIGKYFMPSFAGVAFSKNEYRWSMRIKPEDGLIRLVPGLGTRAVDRLSNDYPILISPRKPEFKANTSINEIIKYSPKSVDVINLETKQFDTIRIDDLLMDYGHEYPNIHHLISEISERYIKPAGKLDLDFDKKSYVVTFDKLFDKTEFLDQMNSILHVLQEEFKNPIDVEFAHDGKDLYLVQCRPQSINKAVQNTKIPLNFHSNNLIFSANKFVSNGNLPNISHIVYVDPEQYSKLSTHQDYLEIGSIVGRLNKMLPKRQFILMGPGRWGSRGDFKLGVPIVYSDINNTSMLIEMAVKHGNYMPELSFGTHFFQDLVESNILYLPLYISENQSVFNIDFFNSSPNILTTLLPNTNKYKDVVRVIDVPECYNGQFLNILMDEEESYAVAYIADKLTKTFSSDKFHSSKSNPDVHWQWRLNMAENIAKSIKPEMFGVKNFYIFGSTKNATASAGSDIDILIHFVGNKKKKSELLIWLDAWDKSLAFVNYQRTGYKTEKLLDIHIVTDKDIANKTSWAIKIGAISDAARPLPMGVED